MAGELLSDRSRSGQRAERARRIQRVAGDDENAARLSRRRRIWSAAFFVVALAPLAFGDSGVWGERGIVHRFAVRAPFLFEADGRGVSVYDVSTNTPRSVTFVATKDESLDVAVS